ncbi:hypothetical protein AOQ84DRAFT_189150 [Glonium stellatum]|uniref:Uncharacterized protein n=1 Tax=Glonium stellatum TaxID=574774 RepID=A0A8E2F6M0_9PEZI|nr:hypothetical protein AOQ84DRAFT_189150 [Glonium stellatum]
MEAVTTCKVGSAGAKVFLTTGIQIASAGEISKPHAVAQFACVVPVLIWNPWRKRADGFSQPCKRPKMQRPMAIATVTGQRSLSASSPRVVVWLAWGRRMFLVLCPPRTCLSQYSSTAKAARKQGLRYDKPSEKPGHLDMLRCLDALGTAVPLCRPDLSRLSEAILLSRT